jgi:hypothetical protein
MLKLKISKQVSLHHFYVFFFYSIARCLYHGCKACFGKVWNRGTHLGRSPRDAYEQTMRREAVLLRSPKIDRVIRRWGCEEKLYLKQNKEARQLIKDYYARRLVPVPRGVDARRSYKGGLCDVLCARYDAEALKKLWRVEYPNVSEADLHQLTSAFIVDFNSFYPR